MDNVLFLLVTCSVESTRDSIFVEEVFPSIKQISNQKNFIAFDNGSTQKGTKECLHNNFKNVFMARENYGYYSAINWCLKSYKNILNVKDLEYFYIIESDSVYYSDAEQKMKMAVDLLDRENEIGSVRCQKYSVRNLSDYSKEAGGSERTRQSQVNHTTKAKAYYEPLDDVMFYKTNLSTVLCGFTRTKVMIDCFDKLSEMKNFSEHDFMHKYYEHYEHIAVMEGGVYEPSIRSNDFCGSYNNNNKIGYFSTRLNSSIVNCKNILFDNNKK